MHLETGDAVNDLYTGITQLIGPVNIRLFIKAGLQLHHGSDLLLVAHCIDQRRHHPRVLCDPVQVNANFLYLGIDGRGSQQFGDHAKVVIRVITEAIPFT